MRLFQKTIVMLAVIGLSYAGQARWKPGQTPARTAQTETTAQVESATNPCPMNEMTTHLNGVCTTSYCTSVPMMEQSLQTAGYTVSTMPSDCQAMVYKQMGDRIASVYEGFKMECDSMNMKYSSAIENWKKVSSKCKTDLADMKKKKNTAKGVAIGAGVVAAGLGTYMIIDKSKQKKNKENEESTTPSIQTTDDNNDDNDDDNDNTGGKKDNNSDSN